MVEHFPSSKIITEEDLTVKAPSGISFRRFGNSRNGEVPSFVERLNGQLSPHIEQS